MTSNWADWIDRMTGDECKAENITREAQPVPSQRKVVTVAELHAKLMGPTTPEFHATPGEDIRDSAVRAYTYSRGHGHDIVLVHNSRRVLVTPRDSVAKILSGWDAAAPKDEGKAPGFAQYLKAQQDIRELDEIVHGLETEVETAKRENRALLNQLNATRSRIADSQILLELAMKS